MVWYCTPGSYPQQGDAVPEGAAEVAAPAAYDAATQVLGWRGNEWHVEPLPLTEVQAARKEAVTELRKEKRDAGVLHAGRRWHSDKGSCDDVSTAVALADAYEAVNGAGSFSTVWKTRDGFVMVGLADLKAAGIAVGICVQQCFAREAALYVAIDTAATLPDATEAERVAAVLAIDIAAGWPA